MRVQPESQLRTRHEPTSPSLQQREKRQESRDRLPRRLGTGETNLLTVAEE